MKTPEESGKKRGRSSTLSRLKTVLGLMFLVIIWFSGKLDISVLRKLLSLDQAANFAALIVFQIAIILTMAARWHLLVSKLELESSWLTSIIVHLKGTALGLVTFGIGVDVARLAWAQKQSGDLAVSSNPVIADRAVGILVLTVVASSGYLYLYAPSQAFIATLITISVLLFGLFAGLPHFPDWSDRPGIKGFSGRFIKGLKAYRQRPLVLLGIFGLAILGHASTCALAWTALRCLGQEAPLIPFLAAFSLVQFFQSLPLTPMGIGLGEGAAVVFYPAAGLQFAAESILICRAIRIFIGLLCIPILFWGRDQSSEVSTT